MNIEKFINILENQLTENFQVSSMIVEEFSNWKYISPADPEKLLYDFYFFSLFSNKIDTRDEKFNYALKEAAATAADDLQKHMAKALKFAVISELRHIFDSTHGRLMSRIDDEDERESKLSDVSKSFIKTYWPRIRYFESYKEKSKRNKFVPDSIAKKRLIGPLKGEVKKGREHSERADAYKAVYSTQKELKMSNLDLSSVAAELFKELAWYDDFGGKLWAQISETWGKILTAKTTKEKVKWIDHAYDLQHNNDTVFQKVKSYYKNGTGYDWIENALSWKRDVEDVRGFYKRVSPQLKKVVAFSAKNIFGKSIDTFKDERPVRVWERGTLSGETWEDGLWEYGVFSKGTWMSGRWLDGVWQSGIWYNGIWESGIWEDGTWRNGTWKDGIWKNGTWLDGRWENGKWREGRWKDGTWVSGDWKVGRIWSKKYNSYVKSFIDPSIFEMIEQQSDTLKELKVLLIDKQ